MASFGDAINFNPTKKAPKKLKATKFLKNTKGKFCKAGKNGKGSVKKITTKANTKAGKGRSRKQQILDDLGGAVAGPSKKQKKDTGVIELEEQFILRLPPGPAMALRHDVQAGTQHLKDKLAIEFDQDRRKSRVTYGGQVHNAKLVDLPCVIQCMKTTDMKTFYTTADISQMVVFESDEEKEKEDTASSKKKEDHRYKWKHGITAPLKNVRKRRFRRTEKKKLNDQADLEKELQQLFRQDCEALEVKWEVIYEDPASNNPEDKQVLAAGGTNLDDDEGISNMGDEGDTNQEAPNILDYAEETIFGEVSSSDEEEEADHDVNVMDSDEELQGGSFSGLQAANDSYTNMSETDTNDVTDLNAKFQELERTIGEIQNRKSNLEMQIESADNDLLKERLQGELQQVEMEEQQKEQEYNILSSMVNTDKN